MLAVQPAPTQPPPATQQAGDRRDFSLLAKPTSEGRVVLRCAVSTQGVIQDCKVLSEEPAGHRLAAAALETASHLHVNPAIRSGRAQAGYITLPMKFVLTDDGKPPAAPSLPSPSR